MSRRFRRELAYLRDDLNKLRSDAAAVVESLLEAGRGHASETREQLSGSARDWYEDLRDSLGEVGKRGRKAALAVYDQIERRPGAVLGAATLAAIGLFVLTRALSSRPVDREDEGV